MNKRTLFIILGVVTLAGVVLAFAIINHFVHDPAFTDVAVQYYTIHSIATRQFEDFTKDHEEVWVWENRTVAAHWISHPSTTYPGSFIIEFDVHPSTWAFTISQSLYLFLRNKQHFDQLRAAALAGGFDDDFTTPEERANIEREIQHLDQEAR